MAVGGMDAPDWVLTVQLQFELQPVTRTRQYVELGLEFLLHLGLEPG